LITAIADCAALSDGGDQTTVFEVIAAGCGKARFESWTRFAAASYRASHRKTAGCVNPTARTPASDPQTANARRALSDRACTREQCSHRGNLVRPKRGWRSTTVAFLRTQQRKSARMAELPCTSALVRRNAEIAADMPASDQVPTKVWAPRDRYGRSLQWIRRGR
jgi:hypothetical protein